MFVTKLKFVPNITQFSLNTNKFSRSLQRKTFAVSHQGRGGGLTLDWQSGFSLREGADPAILWQYKFSQLRGSSDDGKSKLKLHFQDQETRSIETKVSFVTARFVLRFNFILFICEEFELVSVYTLYFGNFLYMIYFTISSSSFLFFHLIPLPSRAAPPKKIRNLNAKYCKACYFACMRS